MNSRPKIADLTEKEWPSIDSIKEEAVLEVLDSVFSKYKSCLRTIKKPPKWKKKVEEEKEDTLTEEEETNRKIFKSQFVVGIQTVMKNLERNKLSAVLLWQDLQPAVLRKALLQLVGQQGCPAVCVTDLHSTLHQSWPGLTSAAALGILKSEETNDFDELVTIIRVHAPTVKSTDQPEHQGTSSIQDKESETNVKQSAKSDTSGGKAQPQTGSHDSKVKTENCPKTIGRPVVDHEAKEFYVYKSENEKQNTKSFSGQSFIALDEESLCTAVETVNGVRVQRGTINCDQPSGFGIRPSLGKRLISNGADASNDGTKTDFVGMYKRQKSEKDKMKSGYKQINLKKLQNNTQKKKKQKVKKKKRH